jgi:hypothetical protein
MRKKKERHEEPKYSKKFNNTGKTKSKNQHSILHKHEQRLLEFKNKNERIKQLNIKIKNIQKDIENLKSNSELNEDLKIHKITKLEYDLEYTIKNKNNIESGEDEQNYLLESSSLIMKYLQLDSQESELLNIENPTDENTNELNKIVSEKNTITDEYLQKFETNYVSKKNIYIKNYSLCPLCGYDMEVYQGFLSCISCGHCEKTIECHNELSYKEMQDYDYRPQFTYDKMSHLDDWIKRFGAKENRVIPQEVLDKVILEAKKERLKDLNLLTEEKVKRYLKKLDLNEYYDNVIGIINRINGRPPFKLTVEVEDKIRKMFQQIQEPYEKFKPSNRRNFLSYSYCLNQMFKILGLHEFAKYFPLLKSADKLRQQDEIFKKIVEEMAKTDKSVNWVFYPSI